MPLYISHEIDEHQIGEAILSGDLQLAHIRQSALKDAATLERLIRDIEHLGGTSEAGKRAAKFAAAMQC